MRVRCKDQEWELKGRMAVEKVVRLCGFDLQSVLVLRNGKLVTEDQMVGPYDEVEIVPTVSGG